jgi:hypothetical protein
MPRKLSLYKKDSIKEYTQMNFMITFPLTHHAYKERISRFLDSRAPPPIGVEMLGRWFTASHSKGFMLVEAEDSKPLFHFVSEWADIMDFVIEPVLTDEEAAGILNDMR